MVRATLVFFVFPFVASPLLWLAVASAQVVGSSRHDPLPGLSRSGECFTLGTVFDLGCSPAPCVLPNVQVSAGQTNSTVIASSPVNPAHLLASAYDYNDCFGAGAFASANGGSTWKSTCIGLAQAGDPALAYGRKLEYVVGTNGASNGASVYIRASSNNGLTWSSALQVVAPLFANGVTNEPWVQVDNSGGSHFADAAYVSVTQFDALVVESEISVSHSTDGGKTWITTTVDPVQYKPEVDQFSRMAVGKDGTVYVAWQRCTTTGPDENCAGTEADMLLSKSTDGGNSWSAPVRIAAVKLLPDNCHCFFFGNLPNTHEPTPNMPVIAIDNSKGAHDGTLYAVMYNWTGKQMRVQAVTSTDGGNIWGKPVLVAPSKETHDQFFPSIAVSPSGMVGVSWLDRRKDPLNVSYRPFAAISIDGGASFGRNYALAKNLSDPYLDGNGGSYMGSYMGNTWAGSSMFLVTWPDTRNMQFMQDYVGGLLIK